MLDKTLSAYILLIWTFQLRQEIARMTKNGHSRAEIEDAVKLETGFTLHRSTYFDIKRNADKILALNTSRAKNANFRRKDETILRQFERDVALRSVFTSSGHLNPR